MWRNAAIARAAKSWNAAALLNKKFCPKTKLWMKIDDAMNRNMSVRLWNLS